MSTHIVSDVESVASELAIMRKGRLIGFDTPDDMIARARGQIWTVDVSGAEYEQMKSHLQILQALRQGERYQLRIAHSLQPHQNAIVSEPDLEDALMAQRYSLQEYAHA